MKKLIILITCIICMSAVNQELESRDYISIEHLGATDKAIPKITIYKGASEKVKQTFNDRRYFVSDKLFKTTKQIAENNKATDSFEETDFGSFKVTIHEKNKPDFSYELHQKKALILFNQLLQHIKQTTSKSDLLTALEEVKNRID